MSKYSKLLIEINVKAKLQAEFQSKVKDLASIE